MESLVFENKIQTVFLDLFSCFVNEVTIPHETEMCVLNLIRLLTDGLGWRVGGSGGSFTNERTEKCIPP